MVNLVLDTTYVLPLFGFDVNGINLTKDKILKLWNEGIENHQLYLPNICLLESLYRINAEIRKLSLFDGSSKFFSNERSSLNFNWSVIFPP